MFKFLKDKLKQGIGSFAKKVEEKGEEQVIEQEVVQEEEKKQKEEKKGFFKNLFKKKAPVEESKPAEEETKKDTKTVTEGKKEIIKPVETKEELEEPKVEEEKPALKEEIKLQVEKTEPSEKKKGPEPTVIKEQSDKKEDIASKPKEEESKKPIEEEKPSVIKEKILQVKEKKSSVKIETPSVQKEDIKVKQEPKPIEVKEETPKDERKGFFARVKESIVTKKINADKFDDIFWELEVILLENNVAVEVIEKIKADLREIMVDKPIKRNEIEKTVLDGLKSSIEEVLSVNPVDIFSLANDKKPYVICFVGVNGSGKTTSIAKIANMIKVKGKTIVLAAADTFRAAAIDQLQIHADNLGIKLIKHDYGSDPAAVAFDAIKYAKSKDADFVLIDTAGRLHSNINLVDEMKKIVRVANPDLKIFVGESITGNDCVEQAIKFNDAVGIDGIVLSKADIDEKGGASLSVSYVTKKPVVFIGTGQEYADIKAFDKKEVIKSLGLAS